MQQCPKCRKYFTGLAKLEGHIAAEHPGFTRSEPQVEKPAPKPEPSKSEGPEGEKLELKAEAPPKDPSPPEKLTFLEKVSAKVRGVTSQAPVEPIQDWELSETKVADFVQGVLNLVKEVFQFIDRALAIPEKNWIDPALFTMNPAERMNCGMILQRPVTVAMKKLGYRTVEEATMFIDAFSLFGLFLHLGMGIAMHGFVVWGIVSERRAQGLTMTGQPKRVKGTHEGVVKSGRSILGFGFRRRPRGTVEAGGTEETGGGDVEASHGGVGQAPAGNPVPG
jgi:hypothetical protein